MTNAATTSTEHDTFCDCQTCLDQLVVDLAVINTGRPAPALDEFADNEPAETVETPATTSHCLRCGRSLRSAKSIAAGYGPTCARKIASSAKAAAQSQPAARVEKATDAIETGAVAPVAPNRFQVVSSDGSKTYDVDLAAGTCTCRAGQFGRACYHLTSAALIAA